MLTCQELIDFLSEYVEGQLPLSQRLSFELHLSLCRHCRAYLHNFKSTIAAAKSTANEVVDIPEDLVNAILKSRQSDA